MLNLDRTFWTVIWGDEADDEEADDRAYRAARRFERSAAPVVL